MVFYRELLPSVVLPPEVIVRFVYFVSLLSVHAYDGTQWMDGCIYLISLRLK